MARSRYKLPNVFVGCQYGKGFDFAGFRDALNAIPFRWYYANTHLSTKHLLGVLTTYIKSVDYCVFDISTWNANVALEIGLAEGLKVDYYILQRRNAKGVPSDIQGLQRIEYTSFDAYKSDALIPQIIRYLVLDHTHPRNIYNDLASDKKREVKFYHALQVLSHLRDNKRFTKYDELSLSKGSYLRPHDKEEVMEILDRRGIIGSINAKKGAILKKNLFPELLRIK